MQMFFFNVKHPKKDHCHLMDQFLTHIYVSPETSLQLSPFMFSSLSISDLLSARLCFTTDLKVAQKHILCHTDSTCSCCESSQVQSSCNLLEGTNRGCERLSPQAFTAASNPDCSTLQEFVPMTLTSTTSYAIQDKESPFWHELEDPTCTKDKQEQGALNRSVLKLAAQMSKQMMSTIVQSCNKTRIKVCSNPSFQNCMQNCKPSNTHPSELKTFARCGSVSAETLNCGFF